MFVVELLFMLTGAVVVGLLAMLAVSAVGEKKLRAALIRYITYRYERCGSYGGPVLLYRINNKTRKEGDWPNRNRS